MQICSCTSNLYNCVWKQNIFTGNYQRCLITSISTAFCCHNTQSIVGNGDKHVNVAVLGTSLDSAIVDEGAFSFRGVQEAPIMAYLRFNRSLDSLAVPLLFILENGTIEATMDTLFSTVTGTEQNDTFETYRAEAYTLDSLRRRLHEHYLEQVHAGRMDTAVERSMFDEYTRLREREKQQAYRFIRRNSYSPAALCLLESMQSQFHEEELQSLLSGFGGRNRNVPVLMNIAQRLRNAHKIEPGNPYVDISLIEQSGVPAVYSGSPPSSNTRL